MTTRQETRNITREDIFIKARMLSEGVRIKGVEALLEADPHNFREIELPKKLNFDNVDDILKLYAKSSLVQATNNALGNVVILDGSGLQAPIYPNKYSRLDFIVEGEDVTISDGGEVLATGSIPKRPAWLDEHLSNGMPITTVLPAMSAAIINIVFTLSCNNYNTGRGCRYCNLFANPVSRRINNLPMKALAQWAKYQAEAVKIATDNGWRGTLAVSGGALSPAQRREYLQRLEIALAPLQEALDEETLSRLRVVYNHYPPENFSDMYEWKEFGIDGTSIDIEVMDSAYFAAICPGKNAYKPHQYWKEAQEASVEIFGPMLRTTGCIVMGIEPMSSLVEGVDERVSKGVMPIPLTFFSAPGSAYWGFRTPTADWLVEAADKIVDIYLKHAPKFLEAIDQPKGGRGPGLTREGRQSTHLTVVFDELQRRIKELMGGRSGQEKQGDA